MSVYVRLITFTAVTSEFDPGQNWGKKYQNNFWRSRVNDFTHREKKIRKKNEDQHTKTQV